MLLWSVVKKRFKQVIGEEVKKHFCTLFYNVWFSPDSGKGSTDPGIHRLNGLKQLISLFAWYFWMIYHATWHHSWPKRSGGNWGGEYVQSSHCLGISWASHLLVESGEGFPLHPFFFPHLLSLTQFFPSLFLFGFFPCATVGREWGWVGTYLPARDNPPQPQAVVGPGHAFRNPCYRLALFSWSAISDTSLSVLHIIRHKTQGCEQLILSSTGILYSYIFNPVTTCLIAWFLPLFHNSFSHAGVFQYWVESGLDPDFRLYQDQLFFT